MRLVLIEWLDSLGVGGNWGPIEPAAVIVEPLPIRSVGWIVAENERAVVIVSHFHEADPRRNVVLSGVGDMTIPRAAITRIADLEEA